MTPRLERQAHLRKGASTQRGFCKCRVARECWRAPMRNGALAFLFLASAGAQAVTVIWDVDPSASFIRLTFPDQVVSVPDTGDVTVRLRDATSNSQWTDAGGRKAVIDGQIVTDFVNFKSIQFLSGSPTLYALEQANLRPNPAQWDALTLAYTGTGTAPAALGARIRGTYTVIIPITFDAAFMGLRSVWFNVASGVVPLAQGGTFAGSTTQFGIAAAVTDVDGLELPLGLGQPIPDLLNEPLPPVQDVNVNGGLIENLGGPSRRLTYTINVPVLIQVDTVSITGSATGQIVAYATIPMLSIPFDFAGDGDVDHDDLTIFQKCITGPGIHGPAAGCTQQQFAMCDVDHDLDVDQTDFGAFERCYSGKDIAAVPSCAQ